MRNVKQININNQTYYFFDDMINIKNVDWNLLKIDKKSYKNIDINYIGYITIKIISDYERINSVNPLCLIIDEVDGYIEENNENKCLIFASTDKTQKVLKKCTEIRGGTKNLIKKINGGLGEYEKDFMKVKFNSDDNCR